MYIGITELSNEALLRAGITRTIQDIDENSNDARVCKRVFQQVLEGLLAEYNWRFATRFERLALVAKGLEGTGAADIWAFIYTYPNDCISLHDVRPVRTRPATSSETGKMLYYVDPAEFFDGRLSHPVWRYEILMSDSGRVVACNIPNAYAKYTSNSISTNNYPPLFREAMIYRMAAALVVALASGKEAFANQLMQQYVYFKSKAISNDSSEAHETIHDGLFFRRYR